MSFRCWGHFLYFQYFLWANTKYFLCAVSVIYPREPVTKTEGLLLSLKCTVRYKTEDCDIQTNWWQWNNSVPLQITDPNKYLITVNETETDEKRLRNIFLTFSSLNLQDSGFYQCDAKCLNSGTQAKGHLLRLNVTGLSWKKQKTFGFLYFVYYKALVCDTC